MSRFSDKIDMRFKYTPAAQTNVARTIARERRRLEELKEQQEAAAKAPLIDVSTKVRRIAK